MNDREIANFIEQKVNRAMNRQGGGVSEARKQSFDYYIGEKYGTEKPGESEIVTRECFEVVEDGLSQILPVFTSSDKAVEFDAVGPEDEAQADQETDIVNYFLTKKNNGFVFLYEWFKDALMFPNGYAKMYMEETEKRVTERFNGLTEIELQMLMSEKESQYESVEILAHDEKVVFDQANQINIALFDVEIECERKEKVLRSVTIPGEEMLVDNDLLSVDMDSADFICHRFAKSKTALIEEGFDKNRLEMVSRESSNDWNDERVNRLYYEEESPDSGSDDDESMQMYWVHDCYVMVDADGDGVAERRHILLIGDQVFENEEDDYQPYLALSSIPMPHKHNGLSQIDVTMDLQLISSTLFRQWLTNIYKINQPKKYVGQNFRDNEWDTMRYLLDAESEFVPARDPTAIMQEQVTDLGPMILPAMQNIKTMVNSRTGVGDGGVLDPDVLQEAAKESIALANDMRSKRIETVVRIFAETGVKQAMLKAHRLLREHQDVPLTLKLRGEWVNVNPANWRERIDVTVNVGLGNNNKDRELGILNNLLAIQERSAPYGLVKPKHAFNTLSRMVETSGLKNPELYFEKPSDQPPPPPPPDPQVVLAQQQMQLAQQEQQRRDRESQARIMMEQQEFQLKRDKEMAEFNLKQRESLTRLKTEDLKAQVDALNGEMERRHKQADIQNLASVTELNQAKTQKTVEETHQLDKGEANEPA